MSPALRRALGRLIGWVAGAWLGTLRFTLEVDPGLAPLAGVPWVLVFWHGQQFPLMRWERRRPTVALVSLSRDGEVSAGALARLGLAVERGSSTRGGAGGLRAVVRRLRRGHDAAFAVDGPRGPHHVVRAEAGRAGAALAAQLALGILVPMASACASAHVFRRAWDRFELPLPFSRVAVALGAPLAPADASPQVMAAAIDRARVVARAAVRAGSRAAHPPVVAAGASPPRDASPSPSAPPPRPKAGWGKGRGATRRPARPGS